MNPISAIVWATFLGSCALQGAPAAIADSSARGPFSAPGLVVETVTLYHSAGFALYGDWR